MKDSVYKKDKSNLEDCSVKFNITKSTGKGLVSGWANVAVDKDGNPPIDWQGDVIDAVDLEDAAVEFMMSYRTSGVMHQGQSVSTVVESIVFTKDKQEGLGIPPNTVPEGWFITIKITDPDVWNDVKLGKYKMFSIQGKAKRVKL